MTAFDLVAALGATPLTVIGSSLAIALGLTGAIVALIKLPGEKSLASMAQAQGANEALVEALEAVERERDYWRARFEECHKTKNDHFAELLRLRREQLPDDY